MDAERWAQVADIYHAALERPPGERETYVSAACGRDQALLDEVTSLLQHREDSVLIDAPVWDAAGSVLDDDSAVQPGMRIGPYETGALIGEGGMGQVFRARDTLLQRDVALKVLPPAFTNDADRMARLRREAEVLASLNHPNIAAIYGAEYGSAENGRDIQALVLELVEGPTLADRLARGSMPLDEALPIARQIASALEAAHERGIVHRDLKPANIKLRPDGTVKVLDFGLAKVLPEATAPPHVPSPSSSKSPVVASPAVTTMDGMLGTAAYLAPEQAKGKAADKRSDVWAFGCVLYEMLTGCRAFDGEDVSDTLAAVVRSEPDWTRLPADSPPSIRKLLRRCLTKDRERRMPAIAAARLDIDEALDADTGESAAVRATPARRTWLPWAVAGMVAVVATVVIYRGATEARDPLRRPAQFTIALPDNTGFAGFYGGGGTITPQLAVSPDGRHVVFVALTRGVAELWMRSVDGLETRRLQGTDQAAYPFWSPDGQWIAFFADRQLKKVPVRGGTPVFICDTDYGAGGSWSRDDVIVFAAGDAGAGQQRVRVLQRVSAGGGAVRPVLDQAEGVFHAWPHFLPDQRHFLYVVRPTPVAGGDGRGELRIGSLDSEQTTTLFATESAVTHGAGHLFFWRNGSVFAQPFDVAARHTTADAFPLLDQIGRDEGRWNMAFSVSDDGVIAYGRNASRGRSRIVWVNRAGHEIARTGEPDRYGVLSLAPDERRVAVVPDFAAAPNARDIWLIDIAQSRSSQFTFGPTNDSFPVWSPDGNRIVFYSDRQSPGSGDLYVKRADGTGSDEPLFAEPGTQIPLDWSRDGRFILFTQPELPRDDLWILPLSGERKPSRFEQTPFRENNGAFSPDGRWLAYQSNESGSDEIYVQPFPRIGSKWRISRGGGVQPRWRGDGRELFFVDADGVMMAVPVETGTEFVPGAPQRLFSTHQVTAGDLFARHQYAVTRDGQRFLVKVPEISQPPVLTVILDWTPAWKP